MATLRCVLAAVATLALSALAGADVNPPSPTYTTASVVNGASFSAAALAPNMIGSIFGTNLSFNTVALSAGLMQNGSLPLSMGGVTVYIGGIQAGLYYVSPTQINFLIPSLFRAGTVNLFVAREGFAGPLVPIAIGDTAPGLFQDQNRNAIATHLDGTLVSAAAPAAPGEWVVIYSTGLGRTVPDAMNYTPATAAAPLTDMQDFSVLLNGKPVDPSRVNYAGLTPGFAGLYQVNLQVPDAPPSNPQLPVTAGAQTSPTVLLFVASK